MSHAIILAAGKLGKKVSAPSLDKTEKKQLTFKVLPDLRNHDSRVHHLFLDFGTSSCHRITHVTTGVIAGIGILNNTMALMITSISDPFSFLILQNTFSCSLPYNC